MPAMRDKSGRTINYLRLSITDRCNLRCCYCMPATGVPSCSHAEVLSYEELLCVAEAAVDLGIQKIRVTGGEPLVRKGLVPFLERLCKIEGISEVTLTTNGLLLDTVARNLKEAGIDRLNVSLDSLDPAVYSRITRGGNLARVLDGLQEAERAGLALKLNMVVMRGINDGEIEDFASLSLARPWSVRFIEYMPTMREKAWRNRVLGGGDILERLRARFDLVPISTSPLCGPAKPFRITGAAGTIGIITPISDHFCSDCNRIRITAQGQVKNCLLSEQAVDLRGALAAGKEEVRRNLLKIIGGKGARHHFLDEGRTFPMSSVGG